RIYAGEYEMVTTFLRTDQREDLGRGIDIYLVALGVPPGHGLAEGEHPLLFIRRVAMVGGIASRASQLVDDRGRWRLHRIADGQADHVNAIGTRPRDLGAQLHEQIRRYLFESIGDFHLSAPTPGALSRARRLRDRVPPGGTGGKPKNDAAGSIIQTMCRQATVQ